MRDVSIGFVGGGHMASSLIGGLLADGHPPDRLLVADVDPGRRDALRTRFGIVTTADAADVGERAEALVLAVKPQHLEAAARALRRGPVRERLIISVAAGVRTQLLADWLGARDIVRAMPNTPALVRSGATVLYAAAGVDEGRRGIAESIMRAVGLVEWVGDEALMDAVTAVSGSGPAYFFLVMELLEQSGVRLGLDPTLARLLVVQTAFGAAKMALESPDSLPPADLRRQVTSPGGTTERAVDVLLHGALDQLLDDALRAARDRATELSDHHSDKGLS